MDSDNMFDPNAYQTLHSPGYHSHWMGVIATQSKVGSGKQIPKDFGDYTVTRKNRFLF